MFTLLSRGSLLDSDLIKVFSPWTQIFIFLIYHFFAAFINKLSWNLLTWFNQRWLTALISGRVLMKSDIAGVNQHNIENGELKTNAGGELGHISSAAGMNFSGEYFICVTGTMLSHRADPLTAPTCKDKRKKEKKKSRVKILLAAQENLQLPSAWLFLTFLTMRGRGGRGGGVGGGGGAVHFRLFTKRMKNHPLPSSISRVEGRVQRGMVEMVI